MKQLLTILLASIICSFNLMSQSLPDIRSAEPVQLSGSLGGNLGMYSASGIGDRTAPFQYGLSARLNLSIYSIDLPIYASIRDNTFNYGATFSRWRINPQYKWVRLHIGDAYLNFNPYTLSGRTIKGYGVELTPGNFRFKMMKGKIEDLRSYQDSTQLGTVFTPTYSREVTAVGIGYGSSSTYLDLYALQSADKLDSLNGEQILDDFTRKSNTVVGSTFSVRFNKNVSLRSNVGVSFQTDNLDSYGSNEIFGDNPITNNLVEANISSKYAYAGDVRLNYNNRYFSLNGQVKYIQPYYQPLTVAFINTDIINYTVGGSTSLFRGKLNLIGSVGIQQNNLSGNKLSTANNLIMNLAANFRLSRAFTGNINYSNFTQDFQARLIQIDDLYTFAITSSVATAALRYTLRRGTSSYNIGIRGGRNNFLTVDESEEELDANSSWNGTLSVGYANDQKWRVNTALTYRTYDRQSSEAANYGLRVNIIKAFFENKLRASLQSSYIYNDIDGLREGRTLRNSISLQYSLNKISSLGLRISHIDRTSTVRSDYSEIRSGFQYQHRF